MWQLSQKNIQTIKVTFHVVLIGVIVYQILSKAFSLLPENWLFFVTSDAAENFICGSIAYTFSYFVLKLSGLWKKTGYILLFTLVLILLASGKEYRIYEQITAKQSFEYFTNFLGQTLLFYLGIYFINKLAFFSKYKKLELELHQTKEQLLRSQLHPHFLFNALNSLYSLSLSNHPETSECILKLSNMMRYLTDETPLKKVLLSKELDFIKQYIAIEKIRFGEDAKIYLKIKDAIPKTVQIAPFLLIILVENAFKHGFYTNSKEAFVNIDIGFTDHTLYCTVENSHHKKQHFQENDRSGKGLKNLQKRLHLLYPKKSTIETSYIEKSHKAQLIITLI